MPSKIHDKTSDRDPASSEAREKRRHKSSRSKRKSSRDGRDDASVGLERSSTLADPTTRRRTSLPVPELRRRASSISPNGSKMSLPYPSFSKAHSREAVGSKENVATTPRQNVFTPDPTDLQERKGSQAEKVAGKTPAAVVHGPPSPPLTAVDQAAVIEDKRQNLEIAAEEMRRKLGASRDGGKLSGDKPRSASARNSPYRPNKGVERSTVSSSQRSKPSTPTKMKPIPVTMDDGSSIASHTTSRSPSPSQSRTEIGTTAESAVESDSTSIAPKQHRLQQPFSPDADDESSPATGPDSSPRTPTPRGTPFRPIEKENRTHEVLFNNVYAMSNESSPMPPPPPPPPSIPFQVPRVDYLMQNGGLHHSIPKNFLVAPDPIQVAHNASSEMPNSAFMAAQVERFFGPFNSLLEDYMKVMSKNGSVAVATGYRSIARRLLDRLEAVFARDISSETCACFICRSTAPELQELEDERGISWGEILEYVCGRRELPPWPAFALDSKPVGLGITAPPMQKLDIDVPDEYREHYIRQSKKTKQSVDRWLAGQASNPSNPPDEADDDTLTFAMLTHLEPEQRPIFREILGIAPSRPASIKPGATTPSPLNAPSTALLTNTGLAIQRLYRLASPPRMPEAAIYLLNNVYLHNVLATLAAVSDGEWEILTSGRFDGFLRSGAEDHHQTISSPANSRNPTPANSRPSRGPTPLPISSTPNSAATGAPVALDEETEIAVLAEVERDIYLGMEALEDAFEALHSKAEVVRHTLRERGAGLSLASQARRGGPNSLEARLGTPASMYGTNGNRGWDSETDDGIDDGISELAPDDSASNVSSSRIRRPKRRNERRTPAPVEEEDETGGYYEKPTRRR
ncbi:hypothetical protein MMC19_002739 [Ptychographa xylographoides]|nr:hypothetical protein [Ptychographa xylographoides]